LAAGPLPVVPKDLDRICAKCLEKAPGRRYPTARALADDLADWLAGRPPRGLPGPVGRALRPTRRQVLVAGLCLLVTAAAVALYRRDPDVIRRDIAADLRGGKPVTLIGATGKPRWFEWRAGRANGKTGLADDGTFTVHAGDEVALVELVPDAPTDAYRLDVQVRHDAADVREFSEVGVFVARRGYPVGGDEAQFFVEFSFNDILTANDRRVLFLPNGQPVAPEPLSLTLRPRLYGQRGSAAEVDLPMLGATSPPISPAGETRGVWRTLAVTVTPGGVACTWDGVPVSLSADAILASAARKVPFAAAPPALQAFTPNFVPGAGLGLFVSWGTSSFRSATITPLN
jgi:serine/threonine-protein kinase